MVLDKADFMHWLKFLNRCSEKSEKSNKKFLRSSHFHCEFECHGRAGQTSNFGPQNWERHHEKESKNVYWKFRKSKGLKNWNFWGFVKNNSPIVLRCITQNFWYRKKHFRKLVVAAPALIRGGGDVRYESCNSYIKKESWDEL